MSVFEKLESAYPWKLKGEPVPLDGGFLHRMYRVETREGTFALKLLNPFVMRRETAPDNFAKAEGLEQILGQCISIRPSQT